jgi:hypothetical protein
MTIGSLFKTQALASFGLIVLGSGASVMAQEASPSNDMARCRQLYSTYNHYNGNASYTRSAQVDTAMAQCEKGNYASGIADLTTALNHAAIPVPPVEAAQAK